MPADHVVAFDGTTVHGHPPYTLLCTHCGARWGPAMPVMLGDWLRRAKAFRILHKQCVGPVGPP